MRSFTLVFLLLLPLPSLPSNGQAHADTAAVFVGTVEFGTNDGPGVRRFLSAVGLGPGNPYCAAFVSFCLDVADPSAVVPAVRSALARDFITAQSIRASWVIGGRWGPPPRGTIVVWKKGNTVFGHAGIVLKWFKRCGYTIEANTSSGAYGSQRDGDGVFVRLRCIDPASYFRITSFTPVEY